MSSVDNDSAAIPVVSLSILRAATIDDVAALRKIRRQAISKLAAPILGREVALEWAESVAHDREHRAVEDHVVTVAEVGQRPIGWVETFNDDVEGLYVDPGHASRGVGHQLMQHAEDEIRSAGFNAVSLRASRNAEAFYRARGYHRVGPRSPDVGLPMTKALK